MQTKMFNQNNERYPKVCPDGFCWCLVLLRVTAGQMKGVMLLHHHPPPSSSASIISHAFTSCPRVGVVWAWRGRGVCCAQATYLLHR